MAGGSPITPNTASTSDSGSKSGYKIALVLMVSLFFMIGFITVLNDVLIPRLKGLFDLNTRDAMLVMFVFFSAYLIWAYPAGIMIKKLGYKKSIIGALAIVGFGLSMFVPAAHLVTYPLFLLALFITASGLAFVQVCINPYIIALGPEETGASRLNLGGALNSMATFIGPIVGGAFILQHIEAPNFPNAADIATIESAYHSEASSAVETVQAMERVFKHKLSIDAAPDEASEINSSLKTLDPKLEEVEAKKLLDSLLPLAEKATARDSFKQLSSQATDVWWAHKLKNADSVLVPYLSLAIIAFMIAVLLVYIELPALLHENEDNTHVEGSALDYMHLKLGAIAIFFYVGVEVSIGAVLILYLGTDEMGALDHKEAASLLAYYWGSAMIGRLIGSYVGTKIPAQIVLRAVTVAAIILLTLSYLPPLLNSRIDIPVFVLNNSPFSMGFQDVNVPPAAICLVLCGLCHSVMWPAIFPLGISKLGPHTSQGSGFMVMGVFGGAVIPLAIGEIADNTGFKISFLLCMACYIYILFYALKGYRLGKIAEMD